jgi:hypothetical protein
MDEVSLRDFIEARIDAMQRALEVRTTEMDRRLEELNNLRNEVLIDRQRYLSRDVYDAGHQAITAKVDQIEDTANERREAQRIEMQRQIDDLKRRFAILAGAGLVLVPLAGVIGAAISRAFGL